MNKNSGIPPSELDAIIRALQIDDYRSAYVGIASHAGQELIEDHIFDISPLRNDFVKEVRYILVEK
jgi:hypothetical protein